MHIYICVVVVKPIRQKTVILCASFCCLHSILSHLDKRPATDSSNVSGSVHYITVVWIYILWYKTWFFLSQSFAICLVPALTTNRHVHNLSRYKLLTDIYSEEYLFISWFHLLKY